MSANESLVKSEEINIDLTLGNTTVEVDLNVNANDGIELNATLEVAGGAGNY